MAKKEKSKEVAVRHEATPPTGDINELLKIAVRTGANVETLERLFDLRERYRAEIAKERFLEDFSRLQAEMPEVVKDKLVRNKDGTPRYKYASLGNILKTIKPYLEKYGFSISFKAENKESSVKATAILMHRDGHSEQSSFEVPIDPEAKMSETQKYGSALTYAKRYSLTSLLGINAEDDDDATGDEEVVIEELF